VAIVGPEKKCFRWENSQSRKKKKCLDGEIVGPEKKCLDSEIVGGVNYSL
jgi:hypothetical protein